MFLRRPRLFSMIAAFAVLSCSDRPVPVPKTSAPPQPAQAFASVAERSSSDDAVEPAVAPEPQIDPDERHRQQIIGTWKQLESGLRWLDVRSDGTATLFIDPDWIAKAIIGDQLTVTIEWSIEDGRIHMRSVAGKPEKAFKTVTALYGRDRDREIVSLDETQFIMLDEDGEESAWTRVGTDDAIPPQLQN